MISVDGLTVDFGDRILFKDVSFQINEKDRIALMGKMGPVNRPYLKYWQEQKSLPEAVSRFPRI